MTYSNLETLHRNQEGISEVLAENLHRLVGRVYTNLEVEVLVLIVWALEKKIQTVAVVELLELGLVPLIEPEKASTSAIHLHLQQPR